MEGEKVFIEVIEQGIQRFISVEAKRTKENFFQIVSEAPLEHIDYYKCGDVVKCAWRYFGNGFDGGIVVISKSDKSLPEFPVGTRVRVSEHAGWKSNFVGTVVSFPEPSITMLGPESLYLIEFVEPQQDRNEDYTYTKAQISNVYLDFA
ncbi:MAG: hypothetical protein FJ190_03065 [Gammaproteobacteria bacterium]|nr:hypothetical protein [Gammaproteobacteria bacterium]